MHCIDCGTQNLDSTRFCKHCGSNIEAVRTALTQPFGAQQQQAMVSASPKAIGVVVTVTAFMTLAGLAVIFGTLIGLARSLPETFAAEGIAIVLVTLGLAGVAGLSLVVNRMLKLVAPVMQAPARLPRAADAAPALSAGSPRLAAPASSVSGRQTAEQPAPRTGYASVTEHTTAHLPNYAPPAEKETPR